MIHSPTPAKTVLLATVFLAVGMGTVPIDVALAEGESTFTIDKIETFPEQKRIKVYFTEPVAEKDLREHLKTVPSVYLQWWSGTVDRNVLTLQGQFRCDTSYLIAVSDGLLSVDGNPYRKSLNTFHMPDRPSRVEFTDKGTVVERDSRQMVHLDLVNIEQVLFEGVRIPPILLQAARSHLESSTGESVRDFLAFCDDTSQSVNKGIVGEKGFHVFSGEPEIDSHLFFSLAEKNMKTPFSVPLSFREGKERGSILCAWFRNNISDGTGEAGPRLLRVTDLGIAYKRCHSNLLVWVTSLHTGEPVKGVSILGFDRTSHAYWVGKTDRDGLLLLEDGTEVPRLTIHADASRIRTGRSSLPVSQLGTLLAATGDDVSYVDLDRKHDLKVAGIPQSPTVEVPPEPIRSHLFTERGVYRPGETVHFKGTSRRYTEGDILPPSEATCEILIRDSKGDVAFEQDLKYSPFGTVSSEFGLEPYAPLGTYTIFLKSSDGKEDLARRTFQVQEYRPPRHYAEVRLKKATRESTAYVNLPKQESILKVTIGGRYYAGGPVKHGKVRWRIHTASTDFPQEDYPDFLFGYPSDAEGDFVETGESILDETGEIEVTVPLGSSVLSARHGLRVTATVVDFDGRASTSSRTYTTQPQFFVGLSKPTGNVKFAEPQVLRVVVLDASGSAVPTGEVEIRVKERSYVYTRKRNNEGNAYMSWTSVWRDQYTTQRTLDRGETRFDFDFNTGGSFLIECSYTDPDGNEFVSGSRYSVSGPSYWNADAQQTFEAIQILPDKSEYQVGDEMRLFVQSARRVSSCLLTLERDHILQHRLVEIEEGEIVLPITPDMRPNVYISLLGVAGRGDFPTYQQEFDTESPAFVFGTANVKVRNVVESLNVTIAGGERELKALPGEEITVDLNVTDRSRKGVRSELAVGVVDERVLALTGYSTPNLDTLLDFLLPLSVFTGDARSDLQNQTPYKEVLNKPLTGGGGGPLGYAMGIQIRKDFDPVAYFNPSVLTNGNGKASVTFRFPDTMTAYRIFAVACDKGSRFATAQIPAVVVKDFYVEPGLPRFLNVGDTFRFEVSAFNTTSESGPVQFDVTPSDELTMQSKSRSYPVDSFDRTLIPVTGTALSPGPASVTAEATFSGFGDAVKKEISIHSGHVLTRDLVFGTATGSASVTYAFPDSLADASRESFAAEDLQVRLTLSGSPFLRLKPGLSYLLRYPYGCVEQTSSGILPLAALRDLAVEKRIPGVGVEEIDNFLEKGVDRLFGMQTSSGGFAYWPGQSKPDLWGTLYAISALTFARESGSDIPTKRMDLGLDFLSKGLNEGRLVPKGKDSDGYALACWLLAKSGRVQSHDLQKLDDSFDSLSRERALLTVLSAHESELWDDEMVRERTAATLARRRGDGSGLAYNAVHRESAIALLAGSTILPAGTATDRIAGQLFASMKPEGRWTSTSDTGWVLLALGKHFANTDFEEGTIRGTLQQASNPEVSFVVGGTETVVVPLDAAAFLEDPSLRLEVQGDGAGCYEVSLAYPRMDVAKDGFRNGFTVQKTIENTAGRESIQVGDIVKVEVEVEVMQRCDYLVLDDPLPAGLVAVNSAIATEEPVPGLASADEDAYWRYWDSDGFYRFVPNHLEMRDERVVAFRDFLWKGKYRYTYYGRAVCAGTFRLPPTKVQLMYWPEVCSYTAEGELKIEESL